MSLIIPQIFSYISDLICVLVKSYTDFYMNYVLTLLNIDFFT